MAWQCTECRAVEGRDTVKMFAVCHHCGKLLCEKHRTLIVDDAFADAANSAKCTAYHCSDCKRRYHPKATDIKET